ncbi:MAG: rod shape-determining protein RodA [Rhodocyclaceae bacterium]|nr:rod shape-determining protein RodA [Rhodocyclaceae bacterium]
MQVTAIRQFLARTFGVLDPPLTVIIALLLAYALIVIISATADFTHRLDQHFVNLGVALCAMLVVARIPPQQLMTLALPAYLVGLVLLVAVAVAGDVSKGARRWLNLGIMRIQPSEMMKIAVPLMLAWYFHKHEALLRARDFLVAGVILALPVLLIAKQPDLGTAILVLAAGVFVIFFAGLSYKLILPLSLAGAIGVGALVYYGEHLCADGVDWPGIKEYQKHRICTLLDPSSDPLGKGFHIIQSTIAVGSGGIVGKGWMKGTQTHLEFIPERHTDFIFAVMAEEFGLVGAIVLVIMYLALITRGLMIAAQATSLFSRLLAGSITMIFFTYAFVNMGMVSGILPVVGVPLPFVSYGGTALVTLCTGLGILMSIRKHRRLGQQ